MKIQIEIPDRENFKTDNMQKHSDIMHIGFAINQTLHALEKEYDWYLTEENVDAICDLAIDYLHDNCTIDDDSPLQPLLDAYGQALQDATNESNKEKYGFII